ncbi:MAG: hypothetical protein LBO20_06715 [Bifidobacteriaceae bacterium]|jgi:hypothetical protein|nr:hypothetical protein [Bifidobacteriaceae bacterium]
MVTRLALGGLAKLGVELWPWQAVAAKVWQLRETVTAYAAARHRAVDQV